MRKFSDEWFRTFTKEETVGLIVLILVILIGIIFPVTMMIICKGRSC